MARDEARSTTRESTLLYNQARRAMRQGNPMAAQDIGREAAKVAINEARNPVRSDEVKEKLWEQKKAMEQQADVENARQVKDARDYNAAGYVKPTAEANSAIGQRQTFFNEMVGQARTGTLDINKARTDADQRGLNLRPEEWAAGLNRLPATSNLAGGTPAAPIAGATPTPNTPAPSLTTPTPATPAPTLATPTPKGIGSSPQDATTSTLTTDPTEIDPKNKTSSLSGDLLKKLRSPIGMGTSSLLNQGRIGTSLIS